MVENTETREKPNIPEALKTFHTYCVVMPYSSNLDSRGKPHLSFYSAFVLNTVHKLYKKGYIKNIIICGENTFGAEKESISALMKQNLLRPSEMLTGSMINFVHNLGTMEETSIEEISGDKKLMEKKVAEENIIILSYEDKFEGNLNNTAEKIKAVARFQRVHGLQNEKFLIVGWKFHNKRIENHRV